MVQLIWVHHFVVVQLKALFVLIMVVIRVISILSSLILVHQSYFCFFESNFGLESLFIVHVESTVICSPLFFTDDVLIGSFSDMIVLL